MLEKHKIVQKLSKSHLFYILEFDNFTTKIGNTLETFLVNFGPAGEKSSRD